jgi:hypothetical protein
MSPVATLVTYRNAESLEMEIRWTQQFTDILEAIGHWMVVTESGPRLLRPSEFYAKWQLAKGALEHSTTHFVPILPA